MLKRLINNALSDICTSVAGSIAGAEDLLHGIAEKDASKIVKGASLIFLGLIMNSKK
jgi:hypothetical protein